MAKTPPKIPNLQHVSAGLLHSRAIMRVCVHVGGMISEQELNIDLLETLLEDIRKSLG